MNWVEEFYKFGKYEVDYETNRFLLEKVYYFDDIIITIYAGYRPQSNNLYFAFLFNKPHKAEKLKDFLEEILFPSTEWKSETFRDSHVSFVRNNINEDDTRACNWVRLFKRKDKDSFAPLLEAIKEL